MVGDNNIEEKVKKTTEERNTSQLEMTMEKVGEIIVEMVEEKIKTQGNNFRCI